MLKEKPPAHQRAFENLKLLLFFSFFGTIFTRLDSDPESESGFTGRIESGSRPDPKH